MAEIGQLDVAGDFVPTFLPILYPYGDCNTIFAIPSNPPENFDRLVEGLLIFGEAEPKYLIVSFIVVKGRYRDRRHLLLPG